MSFPSQPSKPDFWIIQQAVLEYWKEIDAFEQSIEKKPADNAFRFYDGPPFITGTPHYGTLLSSIAKDVIPRYQTMKGKRVERVWGRDCHGLPIEQKVQAKLGWTTSKDIEEKGVDTFINECYKYTKSVSDEWPFYIDNI
jgi:isoleucyl-tRNA synthetase